MVPVDDIFLVVSHLLVDPGANYLGLGRDDQSGERQRWIHNTFAMSCGIIGIVLIQREANFQNTRSLPEHREYLGTFTGS